MLTIPQIKQYLKENHITYEMLANTSGVPVNSLKQIFRGRVRNPRIDTVQAIEKALGLTATGFDVFTIPNIEPLPEFRLVPLVGNIACGTPTLADENIEMYIKAAQNIPADFALRCKGDSMINARIFDGDVVFIHMQNDVENGEIAAVLIDTEATLKRVYKYSTHIELRAENPTFSPLSFEGDELSNIRILGKAVAFISTVR